ncbi:MAG: RDD family protein [Acidobacteria bacterium]|nr:RDD family protein [Acidobacteriota bacterium]
MSFDKRSGAGFALATALLFAFYFFSYIFYGSETPGLQWMGFHVLDYDGNPPRAGRRLVRALGALLSAAALGLGYLWAMADEEALTWHDRMSKTFVTRDPRAPHRFRPRAMGRDAD